MKLIQLVVVLLLVVLVIGQRKQPVLRIPLVLLAVALVGLVLVALFRTPDSPITRFYRSIDGAAGALMAEQVLADTGGASGTVVLVQFGAEDARMKRLVRDQRRGVEQALAGSGWRIHSVSPSPTRSDGQDWSGWQEEDLLEWLAPVEDPVAVISFIGLPVRLDPARDWPPMAVLQLDPAADYRALMKHGILKVLIRVHGGPSPLEVLDQALSVRELFDLRYELVTRAEDL
jgi:hypothetical protein